MDGPRLHQVYRDVNWEKCGGNIVEAFPPDKTTFDFRGPSLRKLELRAAGIGGIGKTVGFPAENRQELPTESFREGRLISISDLSRCVLVHCDP